MSNKDDENDDDDDDDDDFEGTFDFSTFFKDPNKFLRSKQFQRLFRDIFSKMFKNMPKDLQNLTPKEINKFMRDNKDKFGPFIYGFNINMGPEGPKIDSFGNIKRGEYTGKPEVKKDREPLIEINEEADQIIVIAEMPGINRDDIQLKATSRSITISADTETVGRRYFKEVELPAIINSDYAKARYVNGILEIKLKKLGKEKHKDIRID